MAFDPLTFAVAFAVVTFLSFVKGGFGGGFAVVGIPTLSLVMDPLAAGAFLAPVFVAMDIAGFRLWSPSTWSRRDVVLLTPGLLAGIALGTLLLDRLPQDWVAVLIAALALVFVARYFAARGEAAPRARSVPKAVAAGLGSGVTTMVAHAGGVPLAMYLLPLGLAKSVYAGTTSIVFTVGNAAKLGPWLWLAPPSAGLWLLIGATLPAVPLGLWLGWRLHSRIDTRMLYRICYLFLLVTALKLLWDGFGGILAGPPDG